MSKIAAFTKSPPPLNQLDEWVKRGRSEVFSVTTDLTPELAQELLNRNIDNRPVAIDATGVRNVAAYAAAMWRGEWQLNGSTIVVARTGELNDGQHRCLACIEADVAVPVTMVFGVERETRTTLDQGRARSPGDILAMIGETNTNIMATYLQFRWMLDARRSLQDRITQDELLAALKRFPHFHEHHHTVGLYAKRHRLSSGYIAGAHGLCVEANPAMAEAFAEMVCTGVGIPNVNSPAARLRRIYEDVRAKEGRTTRTEHCALWIKAFNNFCRGRTGPLNWRDKDKSEAFPQAVRA